MLGNYWLNFLQEDWKQQRAVPSHSESLPNYRPGSCPEKAGMGPAFQEHLTVLARVGGWNTLPDYPLKCPLLWALVPCPKAQVKPPVHRSEDLGEAQVSSLLPGRDCSTLLSTPSLISGINPALLFLRGTDSSLSTQGQAPLSL